MKLFIHDDLSPLIFLVLFFSSLLGCSEQKIVYLSSNQLSLISTQDVLVQAEAIFGPRQIICDGHKLESIEIVLSLTFDPTEISPLFIKKLLLHQAFHTNYDVSFVAILDGIHEYTPDNYILSMGVGFNSSPHPPGQIWFEGTPHQPAVIQLQDEQSAVAAFSVTVFAHEGTFKALQLLTVTPEDGSIEKLILLDDEFSEKSNIGSVFYGEPKLLRILPDGEFNWLLPTY